MVALALVVLPLGRPGLRFGGRVASRFSGGFGPRRRLFLRSAHHLLDLDGKRPTVFGADQRQGEEREARHTLAIQAGKEAVQSMGVLAGFGHDRFITAEQIDIVSLEKVGPKEEPEQRGPRQDGGEEAVDGPIAAASASPAGDPQHGDTTGHGQHGQRDAAELADCRHRHLTLEAAQEW
jgi:hypothetical protein